MFSVLNDEDSCQEVAYFRNLWSDRLVTLVKRAFMDRKRLFTRQKNPTAIPKQWSAYFTENLNKFKKDNPDLKKLWVIFHEFQINFQVSGLKLNQQWLFRCWKTVVNCTWTNFQKSFSANFNTKVAWFCVSRNWRFVQSSVNKMLTLMFRRFAHCTPSLTASTKCPLTTIFEAIVTLSFKLIAMHWLHRFCPKRRPSIGVWLWLIRASSIHMLSEFNTR